MGENSKIEWCDHTFNPWIGCTKVSAACDNCYAEAWEARFGNSWGPHVRRRTSPANWRKPIAWDRTAAAEGKRARVFCASLADVFDNDRSITSGWRGDLWHLIHRTPNLDWLLLTKRPQNISRFLRPEDYGNLPSWGDGWPNVWLGTTAENQIEADRRIPHLLATPAHVHFLSVEPLLGPVDLTRVGNLESCRSALPSVVEAEVRHMAPHVINGFQIDALGKPYQSTAYYQTPDHMGGFSIGTRRWARLDWVIVGGESGPGARPMHPNWARALRDQCVAAGVAFHFKQWGEWVSVSEVEGAGEHHSFDDGATVRRTGKVRAGRRLDGVERNGLPKD
ncbi:phage Gp37/Gp68 family protein [Stappia indica]|uniref:phage Gp37/Gp68 family protein n=1 Tax=Stappia indica TaxID=538381 RepID=UPI00082C8DA3|nr:phage Gp37/Gp68 family protein [Stappia indica]MCC4243408.1 phage Gp37/Gp68 family protein [Stappia indica]